MVTHIDRSTVDVALALSQWGQYVEALVGHGWEIVEVPADDNSPDAVFIEDAVVMYGRHAVITRPGAISRRSEPMAVAPVLEALGYQLHRIHAPGTLEGGDVLKVGSTVYVGLTERTNEAGIQQLRNILKPLGAEVVVVPVRRALHLKSTITALPDGTLIGWSDLVDDPLQFSRFISMPEEPGAHVVLLDEDKLLIAADAPESVQLLRSLGYEPITVDVSEYQKLEGCVTCLSVRLRS